MKWLLIGVCAPGFLTSALRAAEFSPVTVTVESQTVIDSITSAQLGGSRAHINFPYLKRQADGDLIANYSVGQTQSGMQFGRQSVSTDGGQTWTLRASQITGDGVQASLIRSAGQTSHGFGVSAQNASGFTTFSNSRYNSSDGGNTWDNGFDDAFYSTGSEAYTFAYGNYGDVVEAAGTLYMSLYGTRLGSTKNESILFVSQDDGKHWTRRSTIASYTSSRDYGQMGTEGPSETGLVRLDNGNLLAVYRTGQPFPNPGNSVTTPSLFWSISEDDGNTWSVAKSLGAAGVFPLLRKLDDGSVALTYGRHGAKIMFADPTGRRWTEPTLVYSGPGSGHTELRQREDGKLVYIYDQSGFYPPSYNASPPTGYVYDNDQSANLIAATLDVHHMAHPTPVAWTVEYHGDGPPESAGHGWTAQQSGTSTSRYLAELGQDYLQTSTVGSGVDNAVSYAIDGASVGSPWSRIDFARGLVLDLRARSTTSTAEGSASFSLSDGEHGQVTFDIDSDSVNLEGLGGAAGQVEYTSVGHPGFIPRNWHDYRIVVRPAESIGGDMAAQLFLDGDFSHAILSVPLAASSIDEIRFGDLAGLNNGIMELDYLRFAPLAAFGDFNVDGVVDAADLVAFQSQYGQSGPAATADADGDGVVDGADLLAWQRRVGEPIGPSVVTAVPEPRSEFFLGAALFAGANHCRRWGRESNRRGVGLRASARPLRKGAMALRQLAARRYVILTILAWAWPTTARSEPGERFDQLPPETQAAIHADFAEPPPADRRGPYSTPMYYLMHKGYSYEGNWDADPASRCYDRLKGQVGKDWGAWKLDANHPDWQDAMLRDWAELGLNQTHVNVYPIDGKLDVDPDWAAALRDYAASSEKYGLKIGVRLDALDETKLWSVHPNNPKSRRAEYLKWVSAVATLLRGRVTYYVLGDELTLAKPEGDLPADKWTPPMYLDYFREVAKTIRDVDPGVKVCMFAASSREWFNVVWLLENGYAKLGDGVAINHYDYRTVSSFVADRDRLAPGKLFLTSGVGYISNGTISDRYPEGDQYEAAPSEESQASRIAKTMFVWWDLGADSAPYYLSLRNWVVEGKKYPRWFGFLGFEDYVIADGQLTVKRYPPWYALQAVTHTFYNRDEMRPPAFEVRCDAGLTMFRSFERATPRGKELLIMTWHDEGKIPAEIHLGSNRFRYPVRVSLRDYHQWESLDSTVSAGKTTIRLTVDAEPQIIRLVER